MTGRISISFSALNEVRQPVCLALCEPLLAMPPQLGQLDEKSGGIITKAAEIAKFKGGKKDFLDLVAPSNLELDRLFILGLGKAANYNEHDWLSLGGRIRARLAAAKVTTAQIILEIAGDGRESLCTHETALIALGLRLRAYEFKKYKTRKKREDENDENNASEEASFSVTFACADPDASRAAFETLNALGDGVIMARDLVNEPANILTPEEFSSRVSDLKQDGLDVEILDENNIREIGMNALLAVGQGSAQPSQVAIMRWNGSKDKAEKPLLLVGKGVTFDTGGISIKPAPGMEDMKGDMGGAAAVTGAMLALAKRKAAVNAVGIIGLTENMPSSTAQRPGDIVTTLSGQTVEVINTDAEGRLVLADIMWYGQERFKPAAMITLATLTGAVIVALGKEHAGLFSNDDDLSEQLSLAGYTSGEKVWRLPLHDKYNKKIDSKIADMKNSGGREAGSITAAEFLQRFVVGDMSWAHIDIAGTAMSAPATDINSSWGSGFGVTLLNKFSDIFMENGGGA